LFGCRGGAVGCLGAGGGVVGCLGAGVAQLFETLRYKPEGRGFI